MSFWDNMKKFTQPYSDEEYDDFDDEEVMESEEEVQESAPRAARRPSPFASIGRSTPAAEPVAPSSAPVSGGFSGQVLNMSSGKQEVVLFHAKTFDDAAKAADELRKKKAASCEIFPPLKFIFPALF